MDMDEPFTKDSLPKTVQLLMQLSLNDFEASFQEEGQHQLMHLQELWHDYYNSALRGKNVVLHTNCVGWRRLRERAKAVWALLTRESRAMLMYRLCSNPVKDRRPAHVSWQANNKPIASPVSPPPI